MRDRAIDVPTAISDLQQHIFELAEVDTDQYYLGRETFSADQPTLYAKTTSYDRTTYHGQVCSLAPEQSMVTVQLHPDDFQAVEKAGWGFRQDQPTKPWLLAPKRSSTAIRTVVFAPRHEEELKVVKDIISAAAWWVKGTDS